MIKKVAVSNTKRAYITQTKEREVVKVVPEYFWDKIFGRTVDRGTMELSNVHQTRLEATLSERCERKKTNSCEK